MSESPERDDALVRGPMQESAMGEPCPYCGQTTLVMRSLPLDVPFFGDALQTTVSCRACSFRHADLILTNHGDPVRWELPVAQLDDLNARVVRSASGTIRVPELGMAIEPGPNAEAFVSNAEGILWRLRDIVGFAIRNADSGASRRKAEGIRAALDEMVAGRRPFTLVVEDPTGNSAILHDRATKRALMPEEAARLKRGTTEFRVVR